MIFVIYMIPMIPMILCGKSKNKFDSEMCAAFYNGGV